MRLAAPLAALALCAAAAAAPAATLSGRVTNAAGGGVYPVDIDFHDSSTGLLVPTPGDTTTPTGHYSVTVPAGVYDVTFHGTPASHLFSETFKSQNLSTNQTRNVTMVRGHFVTGRVVRAADGVGVANVNLDFHSPLDGSTPDNVQDDVTDSLGFYTALVDSAAWDVGFVAPIAARLAPIEIPAVNLTADVALGEVALGPGFLVTGTVTDEGFFPVADADLDVRDAGTRVKRFTPNDNTDPFGAWSLVLAPGVYDLTVSPPPGAPLAPVTARSVAVGADAALGNLVLAVGHELRATCRSPLSTPVAAVDLDVDSLPALGRLEVQGDASNAAGLVAVNVPVGSFRVTLTPPVATKLLPVRFEPLAIAGPLDLGVVTFPAGHWVSGTVTEAGTGVPIAGANLDFVRLSNGTTAITAGDVTDAAGFFRVTTDGALYRLVVRPPDATHDTLVIEPFGSALDTTVALALVPRNVGVGGPPSATAAGLSLGAPWPNPAHAGFAVRAAGGPGAELAVWDAQGRRVARLDIGGPAGLARWDGRDARGAAAPAGLYFVVLRDGAARLARRVVVTR